VTTITKIAPTTTLEEKPKGRHTLNIVRRESLAAAGVLDVVSFDEETVIAETDMGMMIIKGNNLHISKLNLESGELVMSGEVNSITYENFRGGDRESKKKSSLMGKLFR